MLQKYKRLIGLAVVPGCQEMRPQSYNLKELHSANERRMSLEADFSPVPLDENSARSTLEFQPCEAPAETLATPCHTSPLQNCMLMATGLSP